MRLRSSAAIPRLGLRAKVLLLQASIVLLVVALTSGTALAILTRLVEQQYGERVLGVAHAVALMPTIQEAFDDPDPAATIQPVAEAVRRAAGLTFVVVANRDRIRYAHPNPARIGEPLSTDPQSALDGTPYVAVERGTLGPSIRAKVPILSDEGQVIGIVSVGILVDVMQDVLERHGWQLAVVAAVSLVLGLASSYLLAQHIRHQIFGLEPPEIAALLEQREASLHGIREGLVAVDHRGTLTLANDEAVRLLNLPAGAVGRPINEVLPDSRLPHVLRTGLAETDRLMLVNGRAIVVSRMPVRSRGELVGAIATFRDQTEMQALARELDGTRSHLESLRAQAHEFANTLHTLGGLVELGWHREALDLIHHATRQQQELVEELPKRIADSALVALLVGKASVAAERDIRFSVAARGPVRPAPAMSDDLVTIVGNLIDNAFEAAATSTARSVRVALRHHLDWLTIQVHDSGPGVRGDLVDQIFQEGFSTKAAEPHRRGVGLALVRRAIERLGGEVSVRNRGGALFTVRLPCASDVAGASPLPLTT